MPLLHRHADQNPPGNPHARHSFKGAHDPSRPRTPPISFGNVYPRDDIVAVLDDRELADRAIRALIEAGIPEDDVDVAEPASVLEVDRDCREHRGFFERLQAWLSTGFSDDAADYRSYLHEAERGHTLVIVHAERPEVVELVRRVLHAQGAHNMRHYEALTVTDLS